MDQDTPQAEPSPAMLFEEFFGPTLFAPLSRDLLRRDPPRPDARILDLACATGTVARQVASEVSEEAAVTGVDNDPAMLDVARTRAVAERLSIEWREEDATDLDASDDTFDRVYCQQGLQFFPRPEAALAEVHRVLRPGGRLALNVWQTLEHHPVYSALLTAEAEYLDTDLSAVATPFLFGDAERLRDLLDGAGLDAIDVQEHSIEVEFGDPDAFVQLTVMAGAAVVPDAAPDDPAERADLVDAVSRHSTDVLRDYRDGDRIGFEMPYYMAVARA